jgi:hypothetical protein
VRPADGQGRTVARSSLVGVRVRVPARAPDADAWAVAALSPLTRSRDDGDQAEAVAVIEFRNKRDQPIVFLRDALAMGLAGAGPACGPAWQRTEVKRGSRPAEKEERILPWSEASFTARFRFDARGLSGDAWTLSWAYSYGGRDYRQSTRFERTDRPPAELDASGSAPGLGQSGYRESASGVPFLMNIPFLGVLFRSSSRSVATSDSTDLGPAESGGAPGTWWETGP